MHARSKSWPWLTKSESNNGGGSWKDDFGFENQIGAQERSPHNKGPLFYDVIKKRGVTLEFSKTYMMIL